MLAVVQTQFSTSIITNIVTNIKSEIVLDTGRCNFMQLHACLVDERDLAMNMYELPSYTIYMPLEYIIYTCSELQFLSSSFDFIPYLANRRLARSCVHRRNI